MRSMWCVCHTTLHHNIAKTWSHRMHCLTAAISLKVPYILCLNITRIHLRLSNLCTSQCSLHSIVPHLHSNKNDWHSIRLYQIFYVRIMLYLSLFTITVTYLAISPYSFAWCQLHTLMCLNVPMKLNRFVTFATEADARSALALIKNKQFNGNTIKARLKTETMNKSYFRYRQHIILSIQILRNNIKIVYLTTIPVQCQFNAL